MTTAAIRKATPGVVLHSDAAQAVGKVPVNVRDADLVTFSAHKIHGPKGVGGLWIRKGTPLAPQSVGGGPEFERRAGPDGDTRWEAILRGLPETLPVSRRQQHVIRELGREPG